MKSTNPKYGICYWAKRYCSEDISLIENYEAMMADTTQQWCCHHILEILENKSVSQLKEEGRYYNRPACELIFLTDFDHKSLHNKGTQKSDEAKKKMSESHTGVPLTDEHK